MWGDIATTTNWIEAAADIGNGVEVKAQLSQAFAGVSMVSMVVMTTR